MTDFATLDINGPTATLTINRPDARNALSLELLEALHARMDELEPIVNTDNPDRPRVVVITGSGRAFCAGMDLKQVIIDKDSGGSGNPTLPLQLLTSLAKLTLRVRTLPAVTLAAVNGAAIGGGCGLACVCDLAISHADAKLGFPEVDLALCPAVIAPWVIKKLGAGPARRALLMGGVMSGTAAHAIGVVDELAEDADGLRTLVEETAERLATGGPEALAATKGLLNQLDGSLDESLVLRGAELSASVLATEDAQRRLIARLR